MSNFETQATLESLRRFVALQRYLIKALKLSPNVNEINFRKELPSEVILENEKWHVKPHGVGVRFQCNATGEVVDSHVGFIESPDAVDAWRLTIYFESKNEGSSCFENWHETLMNLERDGLVRRDNVNNRLFVIA